MATHARAIWSGAPSFLYFAMVPRDPSPSARIAELSLSPSFRSQAKKSSADIDSAHHTPAGMPLRSTLRGAVSSFQADSAVLTGALAGRSTKRPCPFSARTSPSS